MNTKIADLWALANNGDTFPATLSKIHPHELTRFAEMIINVCSTVANDQAFRIRAHGAQDSVGFAVKNHFGLDISSDPPYPAPTCTEPKKASELPETQVNDWNTTVQSLFGYGVSDENVNKIAKVFAALRYALYMDPATPISLSLEPSACCGEYDVCKKPCTARGEWQIVQELLNSDKWQIVPKKPTLEMCQQSDTPNTAKYLYFAMLEVAPQPIGIFDL
jgi:hypothetical protein